MLGLFIRLVSKLFFFTGYVGLNSSFPEPLSKEEEKQCLEAMAGGDSDARAKLIEHNLRLVAHIAKKYASPKRDTDDLISIGTVGLIKAVSTFNSEKSKTLAAYAARCIENAILSQWNKLDLEAKTSRHVAKNGAYSVTYADTGMS